MGKSSHSVVIFFNETKHIKLHLQKKRQSDMYYRMETPICAPPVFQQAEFDVFHKARPAHFINSAWRHQKAAPGDFGRCWWSAKRGFRDASLQLVGLLCKLLGFLSSLHQALYISNFPMCSKFECAVTTHIRGSSSLQIEFAYLKCWWLARGLFVCTFKLTAYKWSQHYIYK